MRQFKLIKKTAVAAMLAGSIFAGGQVLASDFDALLAEVEFSQSTPSGQETLAATEAEPQAVAGAQSQLGLDIPAEPLPAQGPAESLPAVEAHDQMIPAPIAASGEACQSCSTGCQSCSTGCKPGCKRIGSCLSNRVREGHCTPYTPPQIPTSTFYQYWRSNACNVNVWDGYRNRCHTTIDLSIHHKKKCRGCNACDNIYSGVPANWCDLQESCDSCD